MNIEHECAFELVLLELAELYSVDLPSKSACGRWWSILAPYPWPLVERALNEHARTCKFFPRPADIVQCLEAMDGRPAPDEAWAMAVQATNEAATVVWCREIATAWGITLPVLESGDQVAARRTFLDTYARLLAEARRTLTPAHWSASLGHDAAGRQLAIDAAVTAGRLPRGEARRLLGPPLKPGQEAAECATVARRLTGTVTALPDLETRNARRFLAAVQAGLDLAGHGTGLDPSTPPPSSQKTTVKAITHRHAERARLATLAKEPPSDGHQAS